MESRPKIKPEQSQADMILEVFGWLALASLWIVMLYYFKSLPDIIPTHFNAAGEPDGYGNKLMIIILPVIGTILFLGMTILNRYPHIFNYLVKITEQNAARQYALATRMIRYLKLAILLIFNLILLVTCLAATGKSHGLGPMFLPLVVALIFVPLVTFMIRSYKEK